MATKTSRIPRKAKRFFRWGIFCFEYPRRRSGKGNVYFANYRFSFRKLQIPISQTTDSHFANYRFSFRKLQILISQTTDFHFANYRFPFRKLQISISQTTDFHFVSSHFVSQTTVSQLQLPRVSHCRFNLHLNSRIILKCKLFTKGLTLLRMRKDFICRKQKKAIKHFFGITRYISCTCKP